MAYSEKEKNLFVSLGYEDMLNLHVEPITLYRIASEKAFLTGDEGALIGSLRRCFKAVLEANPYRLTEEFDDLISFDEKAEDFSNFRRHLENKYKDAPVPFSKPFLLIAGETLYPSAFTEDWVGCYRTYDEAMGAVVIPDPECPWKGPFMVEGRSCDWYEVVNLREWAR